MPGGVSETRKIGKKFFLFQVEQSLKGICNASCRGTIIHFLMVLLTEQTEQLFQMRIFAAC